MESQTATQQYRRYTNYLGPLNCSDVHLRNPWVVAWWSAAFPGFGHMKLGSYFKGFIFIVFEVIINVQSRVNEAMIYSFNGQFELSKEVLNTKLLFLYIVLYIITIWDSYRQCVDLNKIYLLAKAENAPIVPFKMTGYALNFLDLRNPLVAFIISFLCPGFGHLYLHRLLEGVLYLSATLFIIFKSHFLVGVHLTLQGSFSKAIEVLDPQWLLFLPSIYCFVAYEAYVLCVECNKAFKIEQRQFLQKNYQNLNYHLF